MRTFEYLFIIQSAHNVFSFYIIFVIVKRIFFNDLMDFFKSSFYIAVTGFS